MPLGKADGHPSGSKVTINRVTTVHGVVSQEMRHRSEEAKRAHVSGPRAGEAVVVAVGDTLKVASSPLASANPTCEKMDTNDEPVAEPTLQTFTSLNPSSSCETVDDTNGDKASETGSLAQRAAPVRSRAFKPGELATNPIPIQYVAEQFDKQVQTASLYNDLFLYLPFLVFFLVFSLLGRDIADTYVANTATLRALTSNPFPSSERNARRIDSQPNTDNPLHLGVPGDRWFENVSSTAEFKLWLEDVFVPFTWHCDQRHTAFNPLQSRGQQTNLGAAQLRVQMVRNNTCDPPRGLAVCYGVQSKKHLETGEPPCKQPNPALPSAPLWQYHSGAGDYSTILSGEKAYHDGSGYVVQLPFNATCAAIRDVVKAVLPSPDAPEDEQACAMVRTESARLVVVEWYLYDPHSDIYTSMKLFYEISVSGRWVANTQVSPFPVWSKRRSDSTTLNMVCLLFIAFMSVRLVQQFFLCYRRAASVLLAVSTFLSLWNVVEAVNLIGLIAVVIVRFMWWSASVERREPLPLPGVYPSRLEPVMRIYTIMVYTMAINMVLTVLKVLKYLRLSNRMNMITRALDHSKHLLLSVVVLFMLLVWGYAICGTLLFGTNVLGFRGVFPAINELMLYVFGIFDYAVIRDVEPSMAGIYFFTFVTMGNFVFVNLIIAVLSEGFSQVARGTHVEPIGDAIVRFLSTLRYRLHPVIIRRRLGLMLQGKSLGNTFFEMSQYLKEQINLIDICSPSLLDSDLPITQEDLKSWLPEHIREDLGDDYIAIVWDDLNHSFITDTQSRDYREQKEIEGLVLRGTSFLDKPLVETLERITQHVEDISRIVKALPSR